MSIKRSFGISYLLIAAIISSVFTNIFSINCFASSYDLDRSDILSADSSSYVEGDIVRWDSYRMYSRDIHDGYIPVSLLNDPVYCSMNLPSESRSQAMLNDGRDNAHIYGDMSNPITQRAIAIGAVYSTANQDPPENFSIYLGAMKLFAYSKSKNAWLVLDSQPYPLGIYLYSLPWATSKMKKCKNITYTSNYARIDLTAEEYSGHVLHFWANSAPIDKEDYLYYASAYTVWCDEPAVGKFTATGGIDAKDSKGYEGQCQLFATRGLSTAKNVKILWGHNVPNSEYKNVHASILNKLFVDETAEDKNLSQNNTAEENESANNSDTGTIPAENPSPENGSQNDAPQENVPQDDTPQENASAENDPQSDTPQENVSQNDTPQENVPQDDTPQENASAENDPQNDTPQESVPRESAPQDNNPQENTTKENTSQENIPQDNASEENDSQNDTPQESVPQNDTPKENVPQDDTPHENIPQNDTPQDVVAQNDTPEEIDSAEDKDLPNDTEIPDDKGTPIVSTTYTKPNPKEEIPEESLPEESLPENDKTKDDATTVPADSLPIDIAEDKQASADDFNGTDSSLNSRMDEEQYDGSSNNSQISEEDYSEFDSTYPNPSEESSNIENSTILPTSDEETVKKPETSAITNISSEKKAFVIKWKKSKEQITGYQVQFSTSRSFNKNAKIITIKKSKDFTKKIKNLKAGKTYYVRIRTYVKGNDKDVLYSKWSKRKEVKTR